VLLLRQERNKGQTTEAGSLDPVIGKIICAAPPPTCKSYFDAMRDKEGSNDESAPVGEGDSDCDEASSIAFFNPPDLLNIWECPLMNMTQVEIEEGVWISGWSCGHFPARPVRGAPKFFKHINATKALAHILRMKGHKISICKGSFPYEKKCSIKPCMLWGALRKGKERYGHLN